MASIGERPARLSRSREFPAHGAHAQDERLVALAIGALGIVFGDIGTSPLYAFRECFHGPHGIAPTPENVRGVLSLIFWSLIGVISIKYVLLVMRADNDGEGGILALMALVSPAAEGGAPGKSARLAGPGGGGLQRAFIVTLGLFGAALLYGDGAITPAISVLSAVEGLAVATPALHPTVLPLAIAILIGLFLVQRHGTAAVGRVFGPVTLLWFLSLGALGVLAVWQRPDVLTAASPLAAAQFVRSDPLHAFFVLGAVFLVVTGGEALYADMGHFGRRPIRAAWFAIVLPMLLLNYFGQGALLLGDRAAAENPFYRLVPGPLLYPMVALATAATVIASQALISGAFSITRQAIQLGYLPRLSIRHTSAHEAGQIYIPEVNWALLVATVWLVLEFKTSSGLAAAYGIAVTMTMVITVLLIYFAMRRLWGWGLAPSLAVTGVFLAADLAFFGANALKIAHGGWVPLLLGASFFTVMATWRRGREILAERLAEKALPLEGLFREIDERKPARVPGTAVYLSGNPAGAPPALIRNLRYNKAIHEHVLLVRVVTAKVPFVLEDRRIQIEDLPRGFTAIRITYGFMEEPDVPHAVERCRLKAVPIDLDDITYILGRETLIATERPGMAIWRERLFAFLSRNALRATAFFKIPSDRVLEIGTEIEL
jgi:KUP system potassium uptake protein